RLGDINGDGIADIAIGSAGGDGEMNIILGNAGYTGSTTPTSMATLADITFSSSIANQIYAFNGVGDFNGDGFDDFALLLGGDTLGAMEMYVVFGKET